YAVRIFFRAGAEFQPFLWRTPCPVRTRSGVAGLAAGPVRRSAGGINWRFGAFGHRSPRKNVSKFRLFGGFVDSPSVPPMMPCNIPVRRRRRGGGQHTIPRGRHSYSPKADLSA